MNMKFLLGMMGMLAVVGAEVTLTPPVPTSHGPVVGSVQTYSGTTLHVYKSIPYAAPPVGDLRFARPQPPEPWTEPRMCIDYTNRCVGTKASDKYFFFPPRTPPPMDEDCLHLSIAAPQGNGDNKRAVMLYIHGGGFAVGSSADVELQALAVAGDVVHVSINYRLNVFGFLATTDESAPGNAAFYDQLLALKWVKENIAAFGGDPERITIFGVSAGGWSVSGHMVSPLSRGLFNRAISQSGVIYTVQQETASEKEAEVKRLAAGLGCTTDDVAAMLVCLRQQEAEVLEANATATMFISLPTYGEEFFPQPIADMYDQHMVHPDVDYIVGITSDEGLLFLMATQPKDDSEVIEMVQNGIDKNHPLVYIALSMNSNYVFHLPPGPKASAVDSVIKNLYFKDYDDKFGNARASLDLISDTFFVAASIGVAKKVAEAGNKVYLYMLDQVPMKSIPTEFPQLHLHCHPDLKCGTSHGFDIPYMFGLGLVKDAPMAYDGLPEEDIQIARSMGGVWAEFSKTGDTSYLMENGEKGTWPQFTLEDEKYIVFKYPMSEDSIKQRLKPGVDDLYNKLLKSYIQSLPDDPPPEPQATTEDTNEQKSKVEL